MNVLLWYPAGCVELSTACITWPVGANNRPKKNRKFIVYIYPLTDQLTTARFDHRSVELTQPGGYTGRMQQVEEPGFLQAHKNVHSPFSLSNAYYRGQNSDIFYLFLSEMLMLRPTETLHCPVNFNKVSRLSEIKSDSVMRSASLHGVDGCLISFQLPAMKTQFDKWVSK